MADLALTKFSGQLASQLTGLRRSKNAQGDDTGLQRIGVLVSNAGVTVTCYYNPDTHAILWDDGTPILSQQ